MLREQQRDADAEKLLRGALKQFPKQAELHHALGLLLVRAQRVPDALKELELASRLGKGNARLDYVYAVALKGTGAPQKALGLFERILKDHPNDPDTLLALAVFERELGHRERAKGYAERLAALRPGDAAVGKLLGELSR